MKKRFDLRQLAIGGCVLGALVVAMCARPLLAVRKIGLDGLALVREGSCSSTVRVWREVVCNRSMIDPAVPSYATSMQLAAWTRQLNRASRTWSTTDSVVWRARIDSVQGEMRFAHYARIDCDVGEMGFTIGEAWRVGRDEIRLYGVPALGPRVPTTLWHVDVMLVPHGSVGRGLPPPRELHLERVPRLFQEWITSQFE
jgi:hypothetical protein